MSKIKILIVEDDPNLGKILFEYLDAKNFDISLAIDGEEGLEKFLNNTWDLLLLDVMMPKKDGFSLAKDIRKVDQDIPIIFLTAKSQKDNIIKAFNLGAYTYIHNQNLLIDKDKKKFSLTTKENELLKLFCLNINNKVERNAALIKIWGDDSYYNARSMDVYIAKLRKQLQKDSKVSISNIHGEGFRLIVD